MAICTIYAHAGGDGAAVVPVELVEGLLVEGGLLVLGHRDQLALHLHLHRSIHRSGNGEFGLSSSFQVVYISKLPHSALNCS